MKKNLISILILALMVVNVILTAIMMFSVMGTAKKTGALVTNIATVLNLELDGPKEETEETVQIADSEAFDVTDAKNPITVPLKRSDDKDHYCIVNVSLYMNKKHEDYESFQPTVASNTSLFKSIIIDVIGSHTIDEAKSNPEMLKQEILARIQTEYGSTFIYRVEFSNIMYQ